MFDRRPSVPPAAVVLEGLRTLLLTPMLGLPKGFGFDTAGDLVVLPATFKLPRTLD